MLRKIAFVHLVLTLLTAINVQADTGPQLTSDQASLLHGGNSDFNKSSRDTVVLIGPWGSGAQANGQFEDAWGIPAWNGWTHHDPTQPLSSNWQISDYNANNLPGGPDNLAAYCGDATLPACSPEDPVGGYGNNYHEILRFNYTVADPMADCSVTVSGVLNHNTEPGYDFTHFQFRTADATVLRGSFDGVGTAVPFSYSLVYDTFDYAGENQDQVTFEIVVRSDGAWSNEDCLYTGNGACQVDDLLVSCSNGDYSNFTDFEDGFGDWETSIPSGVGDFASLWWGLEDIDPCHSNYSGQVAFINDGTQVPGVPASPCIDWCYGPGGYIVNPDGGASEDPTAKLHNIIESPVVTWPGDEYQGGQFRFGVYRHEDLSADSPGMFYTWNVRSAVDPADIESAEWVGRNFFYMGGPEYIRDGDIVSDLLVPGRTSVQVQLACYQAPFWWFTGLNGTPAPYFDNVRLTAFPGHGPGISTRSIDLANDNFPASGQIDLENLASNSVRFDNSQSKARDGETHNIPGDSITCQVATIRVGGELVQNRLHYTMQRNPVFDSVRDPGWGPTGYVDGLPVIMSNGLPLLNSFAYDLPDSGFLFPGDVLHYYFSATDEVGHADPQTATMPADLEGFGDFSTPQAWDANYQMRALPSVGDIGQQPSILFWHDYKLGGEPDKWLNSFQDLGMVLGWDYDFYFTHGATSGVGNGLGGRATDELMDGYSTLLYTAGDLGHFTLSNGDANSDRGTDIQLLTEFMARDEVEILLCGDNLASDLVQSGPQAQSFLSDAMNVVWERKDIRTIINNQVAPMVLPELDNNVFFQTTGWIAYGGCPGINTFDGVIVGEGAESLARFTNPSGVVDYQYSAATLNYPNDDKVISLPYDFMNIYNSPEHPGPLYPTRSLMLSEILGHFGYQYGGGIVSTPDAGVFSLTNYPNPFNPVTKIEYNLPQAGRLTMKIYNIRGELVRNLIDEERPAGNDHVMWAGKTDSGAEVSSGVYFCEVNAGGEVLVQKMALIK